MQNKNRYSEEAKNLQRAAGIKIDEEMFGYDAGVEMEEDYDVYEDGTDPDESEYADTPLEEREMYGYDKIQNASNSIKAAEEALNGLIEDQKFNGKFKAKFQVYSAKLNDLHAALNNIASANEKPGKTLKP